MSRLNSHKPIIKNSCIFFQAHYASISANILHALCFFSFPSENDETGCFINIVIRIRVMTLTVQKQGQFLDFLLFLFKQTHKRITTTHQTSYQCFCKGKMKPQEIIFATHQTYYHYPSNFLPLLF